MLGKYVNLNLEIGLPMSFKELGIAEKEWNSHIEEICLLAFEDQCSPCNPRVPLVEDKKVILKKAYKGEW